MTSPLEVFVVDEEESVRRAVERLLRTAGYAVRGFASAEDVLAAIPGGQPACIIIDVRMPGINGLDLFDRLRQTACAPVIFITGHGDIPMAVRAMKAGARDFLAKPFNDEALLGAVAEAVSTSG